jgi:hypothetical protein
VEIRESSGLSYAAFLRECLRSNWRGFVAEVTKPKGASSPARQAAKRAYLLDRGYLLTAFEYIQERYPRAARAFAVPLRIVAFDGGGGPRPGDDATAHLALRRRQTDAQLQLTGSRLR